MGLSANALLASDAYQAAMNDIETYYCDLWKDTKDPDDRDKIWLSVQNLRRLKIQLNSYYSDYVTLKENGRLDAERDKMSQKLNKAL